MPAVRYFFAYPPARYAGTADSPAHLTTNLFAERVSPDKKAARTKTPIISDRRFR